MKAVSIISLICIVLIITSCSSSQISTIETGPPIKLAVLDFKEIGVTGEEAKKVSDVVYVEAAKIIENKGMHYTVIEQNQFDKIIQIVDSQNNANRPENILQIDRILIGSVGFVGETYSIAARIVDVKTGAIVHISDIHQKKPFEKLMTKVIPKLTKELFHKHLSSITDHSMIQKKRVRTITVLDLTANGVLDTEAKVFSEKLRSVIVSELNKKGDADLPVERTQMKKVLDINPVNNTDNASKETGDENGKLLGVDRMIIGSISLVGRTYSLSLRIVDVEGSKVIKTISRSHAGTVDDFLVSVIPKAGRDLLQ